MNSGNKTLRQNKYVQNHILDANICQNFSKVAIAESSLPFWDLSFNQLCYTVIVSLTRAETTSHDMLGNLTWHPNNNNNNNNNNNEKKKKKFPGTQVEYSEVERTISPSEGHDLRSMERNIPLYFEDTIHTWNPFKAMNMSI